MEPENKKLTLDQVLNNIKTTKNKIVENRAFLIYSLTQGWYMALYRVLYKSRKVLNIFLSVLIHVMLGMIVTIITYVFFTLLFPKTETTFFTDTDTDVQYVLFTKGFSSTTTPRINIDGTPYVSK